MPMLLLQTIQARIIPPNQIRPRLSLTRINFKIKLLIINTCVNFFIKKEWRFSFELSKLSKKRLHFHNEVDAAYSETVLIVSGR